MFVFLYSPWPMVFLLLLNWASLPGSWEECCSHLSSPHFSHLPKSTACCSANSSLPFLPHERIVGASAFLLFGRTFPTSFNNLWQSSVLCYTFAPTHPFSLFCYVGVGRFTCQTLVSLHTFVLCYFLNLH